MVDTIFISIFQLFIAAVLCAAGIHKLTNLTQFVAAMEAYQLLPSNSLPAVARGLMVLELMAAGCLFLSANLLGGLLAVTIFGVYCIVMAISIQRGLTEIDCGCSFLRKATPLSYWHLCRNAGLVILSFVILLPDTGRELFWFDRVQIITGVMGLAILYLCIEALLSNRVYLLPSEEV